ncbi:MAG: tRNA (N6-isopentenyl adenosine(37)-C2)-methylthiotransferase MiaB [Gemmatimonadota bacterium]
MSELVQLRRASRPASGAPLRPDGVRGRVYLETYGCQMNIGDSEILAGALARRGYSPVTDPAEADVIVVNTCAIREHAERRVLGRIGQLQRHRRENPELLLAVTGCMAQRLGRSLLERVPGVDVVAGPDAYRRLGGLIDGIRFGGLERGQHLLELDGSENYEHMESARRGDTAAWITVQRGCDHRCTFCIVPFVRGPEKNRAPGDVLAEVRAAVEAGFTEVTLLGQTVNSYAHGNWDFARLLRAVARTEGLRRVRFTSPHPNDVTEALAAVMAEEPTVCRQLHLPVQSGADRILRRMVRRYTVEGFLECVALVRERMPDIALSTDVIVAFPGETEEEFEATLSLLRRVRFDEAYLYRYSLRKGTPAERFPAHDFVPETVAGRRLERAIEVQRRIQREINEREVGRVVEVLAERSARSPGDLLGRTQSNKVVAFPAPEEEIGAYHRVRLLATSGATFTGERVA